MARSSAELCKSHSPGTSSGWRVRSSVQAVTAMKWARRPAGRGHGWESSPEGATKASLAIRKASGIKLGNPINIQAAGEVGRKSLIDVADEHARSMLPLLRTL